MLTPESEREWRALVEDVGAFLEAVGVDGLAGGNAVARLVRETAIAAFVSGAYIACGTHAGDQRMLPDTEIMRCAREAARCNPDLYPAWWILERNAEAARASESKGTNGNNVVYE